ncbi:MAG TPA: hypothetical protein VHV55_12200 [Pirellulales bacterium]|nr:hypothetical protein [Pirellulales bacterium]
MVDVGLLRGNCHAAAGKLDAGVSIRRQGRGQDVLKDGLAFGVGLQPAGADCSAD